jgi:hypothetical protein
MGVELVSLGWVDDVYAVRLHALRAYKCGMHYSIFHIHGGAKSFRTK